MKGVGPNQFRVAMRLETALGLCQMRRFCPE